MDLFARQTLFVRIDNPRELKIYTRITSRMAVIVTDASRQSLEFRMVTSNPPMPLRRPTSVNLYGRAHRESTFLVLVGS